MGLSEIFGAQIAGGIGSVTGGATAISTGISLCAFGPWGIAAGVVLMAVGGLTIAGNIGMKIASNNILNNIVNNHQSAQNYKLWQMKTFGRYTTQYVPGTFQK